MIIEDFSMLLVMMENLLEKVSGYDSFLEILRMEKVFLDFKSTLVKLHQCKEIPKRNTKWIFTLSEPIFYINAFQRLQIGKINFKLMRKGKCMAVNTM